MQKTFEEDEDLSDENVAGAETKVIDVKAGDNLLGVLLDAGTDKAMASAILDSLDAVFGPDDLRPGQKIDFRLVPAPSDSGQMEPVRVSIFDKSGTHIVSATRNRDGDYLASTKAPEGEVMITASNRASLYQSFYRAALDQHLPGETILKLLRVHSYDVDFKQKVRPGDTFEVFFDSDGSDGEEMGELLYTSMTVGGEMRKFYRFRTPDDAVDYYDEHGNSAKKFLMRNPVKGGRYTSGFGNRKHPLLRRIRMHTGATGPRPPARRSSPPATAPSRSPSVTAATATISASATPTASPPPMAT
ncbi:hypothetical protein AUC69_10065 [Methyloceanibacter superfactus]|uniref:LysM domain-containing protein n=1 Tax=Methyloceanibacter superfactus TaxID=1774969 RepID=A0A1E3VXH9_9HYPH|nr:hypothetical protein [Methyloceanibacter superfactus]ODR98233.1 hypothetical protein AUC69_10065 [Methyloceanibacter superfactus]